VSNRSSSAGLIYCGGVMRWLQWPELYLELKIKGNMSRKKSIDQLLGYMDKCGSSEGYACSSLTRISIRNGKIKFFVKLLIAVKILYTWWVADSIF
jgi:hypothetical protein